MLKVALALLLGFIPLTASATSVTYSLTTPGQTLFQITAPDFLLKVPPPAGHGSYYLSTDMAICQDCAIFSTLYYFAGWNISDIGIFTEVGKRYYDADLQYTTSMPDLFFPAGILSHLGSASFGSYTLSVQDLGLPATYAPEPSTAVLVGTLLMVGAFLFQRSTAKGN